MRELTLDETSTVGGGWEWDNQLRVWASDAVGVGAELLGAAAAAVFADGPLPFGDAIGAALGIAGAVTITIGGAAYTIGSVGGLADWMYSQFWSSQNQESYYVYLYGGWGGCG